MPAFERGSFGPFKAYTVTEGKGKLTAVERGAQLISFSWSDKEFIWAHRDASALVQAPFSAGSAVLIPFANRVKGGRFTFSGRVYSLPVNEPSRGNAIHGLLYDKPWQLICEFRGNDYLYFFTGEEVRSAYPGRATGLILAHDFEGVEGYPFPFRAWVEYSITDHGLFVNLSVENRGRSEMPVTMGTHPYYVLGGDLKEWTLEFKSKGKLVTKDLIPTGEVVDAEVSGKLDERSFDDCYLLDGDVVLRNAVGLRIIAKGFPYLQVYTPPSRAAIAVEPMTGAPDAFNNGMGLAVLKPGSSLSASYEVVPFERRDQMLSNTSRSSSVS
ncbi:MAG: hypothetical protein RXR41_03900 [Candidatus Marsarchaeota archaeon]